MFKGILMAAMMLFGAQEFVLAQQQTGNVDVTDYFSKAAPFTGSWAYRGGYFKETEACGHWTNPAGDPVIRCSLPLKSSASVTEKGNQGVEEYLHPRALAFREFMDERLSSKWFCLPPTLPAALDGMVHTFDFASPNELRIQHSYYWEWRSVWMDGRKHPPGHERFYNGHSIGRFEGNELVIETTNFLFDPDGLDDHLHLPSSPMKKVTERYRAMDEKTMSLTITVEDPLFLLKPYTWTIRLEKAARPEGAYDCDVETTFREVDTNMPDPYANVNRSGLGTRTGDRRNRN